MIEIKSRLRRWGNSFGVVVPIRAVEIEKVSEGDEVSVFFRRERRPNLRKLFGKHKFSKSTDRLMREMDEELYDD